MATGQNEKKTDLRIRRTYKLLFEALLFLLEEQPFEKISVTDICDRAMVHRTTFYKHFEDKYQLLMFGIKDLQKKFNENSITDENVNNPHQYSMDIFKCVIKYLFDNQKMYSLVLSKNKIDSIIIMLFKAVIADITLKLELFEKKGVKYIIPTPVIANFRAGALVALTIWWFQNDMAVSLEDMANYVELMFNNDGYLFQFSKQETDE
jgi:AcrR family transcriptional regulator